jgi:branched-chain amino acid transport system ATP-binding protein
MPPSLRLENIGKRFGGYDALAGVSTSVRPGEIHALIGPNGAGKTTLINIASGLMRPSDGRLHFGGCDYTGRRAHEILKMGIARNFQHVRLFRKLSVIENVMVGRHARTKSDLLRAIFASPFSAPAAEREAREHARELLRLVGLGARTGVASADLTLVEQRRLEIARALATGPSLLMLDEPAAGMNPIEVDELRSLIFAIRDRGITILLIEHHMRLVMSTSDTITVLGAGRVIAEGSPAQMRRNPTVATAYMGFAA